MKSPIRIRLTLAEGHWALGEQDEALECLRRGFEEEPGEPALGRLVERFLAEVEQGAATPTLRGSLEALKKRVQTAPARPPETAFALATPTMAELLEQQGHRKRALEVAEEVLARNPREARALAVRNRLRPCARPHDPQIAILERWLHYYRQPHGEAQA